MPSPLSQLYAPQAVAAPVPTARPPQPEDTMTPGQQYGLQYSRDRYQDGTYQVNPGPDPSVTSFMGAIAPAPGGGYINYPTFWDGKVIDRNAALQRALQHETDTGKMFARYPDVQSALAGEQQVHGIMEQDAGRVLAWPETQRRLLLTPALKGQQ